MTTEAARVAEVELNAALDALQAALRQADLATETLRTLAPRLLAAESAFEEIEALVRASRGLPRIAGASDAAPAPVAPPLPRPVAPATPPNGPAPAPRASKAPPKDAGPSLWPRPDGGRAPKPAAVDAAVRRDSTAAEAPSTASATSALVKELRSVIAPKPEAPAAKSSPGTKAAPAAPRIIEVGREAGTTCFRLEFECQPGPLDLRAVDDAVGEHPAVRDVALLDYDGRRASLKVWVAAGTRPADVQSALTSRAMQIFGPEREVHVVALEDVA